jgi:hypothetical protein
VPAAGIGSGITWTTAIGLRDWRAMTTGTDDGHTIDLSSDERAAIRAYLQRADVRLSTMHRVASALLSGAGLMVLLPAVSRDSVVDVVHTLLAGRLNAVRLLLLVAVGASLALPFTAMWLVLRDITRFYFHSNHIAVGDRDVFTPRFTLTGLRLPRGELSAENEAALERARHDQRAVELLVPTNDSARARIDERIAAYGGLGSPVPPTDADRATALFTLAASTPRELLDEVAKVEHGMARHVLGTQALVLRYVKALVALLTTALAAFAAAAVVNQPSFGSGEELWLAGILVVWAPVAIAAVTSPVRWLDRQLRSEGAVHTGVTHDPELTRIEDATVRIAVASFIASFAAMVTVLPRDAISGTQRVVAIVVIVAGLAAVAGVIRHWAGRDSWHRLVHTSAAA